eukprot:4427791-Pleurochrysis_carterae.AAC.2
MAVSVLAPNHRGLPSCLPSSLPQETANWCTRTFLKGNDLSPYGLKQEASVRVRDCMDRWFILLIVSLR